MPEIISLDGRTREGRRWGGGHGRITDAVETATDHSVGSDTVRADGRVRGEDERE